MGDVAYPGAVQILGLPSIASHLHELGSRQASHGSTGWGAQKRRFGNLDCQGRTENLETVVLVARFACVGHEGDKCGPWIFARL